MKYLSILLMIGFIGISTVGILGVHAQTDTNMHAHNAPSTGNCISATVKGVDCPKQADPIDFFAFHTDVFRTFSTATFGENVIAGFLLTFASLAFMGLALFFPLRLDSPELAFYRYRSQDSFSPPQKQEYLSWLALHENSPATL